MKKNSHEKKIQIFKALANPVRLKIIEILTDGEKCVCEIAMNLGCEQSHISKSLAILKTAGLIKDRKDGLNVYYSLAYCCLGDFFNCLDKMLE